MSANGILQYAGRPQLPTSAVIEDALQISLQHAGHYALGSWKMLVKITDYRVTALTSEERQRLLALLATLLQTINAGSLQTKFMRMLAIVTETLIKRYSADSSIPEQNYETLMA